MARTCIIPSLRNTTATVVAVFFLSLWLLARSKFFLFWCTCSPSHPRGATVTVYVCCTRWCRVQSTRLRCTWGVASARVVSKYAIFMYWGIGKHGDLAGCTFICLNGQVEGNGKGKHQIDTACRPYLLSWDDYGAVDIRLRMRNQYPPWLRRSPDSIMTFAYLQQLPTLPWAEALPERV